MLRSCWYKWDNSSVCVLLPPASTCPLLPSSLFGVGPAEEDLIQALKQASKQASNTCHICSILTELNHVLVFINWFFLKIMCMSELKCILEYDSKSLCSPCAMQYHDYTKDSFIDQLAPSSGSCWERSPLQRHCTTTFSMRKWVPSTRLSDTLPLPLQGG